MEYIIYRSEADYLQHFGVKGQKWGVRRFENEDGTLTEAGKVRYAKAQLAASKYQTAKERMKKVGKAGLAGAAVGASFLGGIAAQYGHDRSGKGVLGSIAYAFSDSHTYAAGATAVAAAMGGLGFMAVSGINQGIQAAKVKRGQNFVANYKDAFEKTYTNGGIKS